jgi:hypothetical protein
LVYRWDGITSRQRDELIALSDEEGVSAYENRTDALLSKGRKGRVDVVLACCVQNYELHVKNAGGVPHLPRFSIGKERVGRVDHKSNRGRGEQLQALCGQFGT